MEADINQITDVEPHEAQLLIGLIETLVKDWYIHTEQRKKHLTQLSQLAAAKKPIKGQTNKLTPAGAPSPPAAIK